MIIRNFTDNDLYKFTTMNAVQKLYPEAEVKYEFINRNHTEFPPGFAELLQNEVQLFADLKMTRAEEEFITSRCNYFDPVFIDLLKGFRFDPDEVHITQDGGILSVEISGLWYRTVLWEVPLLALISELYFRTMKIEPVEVEERAARKAGRMKSLNAEYSDFGTRRRFSFDVHNKVIGILNDLSGGYFRGTSNVFLAMKNNITPIGTHPHEWFMFHAARYGYRNANARALDAWVEVYRGDLGIALSDTYTSDNFFRSFSLLHAKLFDGVRHDSGDPIAFTERTIRFYREHRIDPSTKTIVFSDALNPDRVQNIRNNVAGRIHDVYGIGTYLSNDAGTAPLNIVIKLSSARVRSTDSWHPTVKLSDDPGKYTGDPAEIELCRKILNIG